MLARDYNGFAHGRWTEVKRGLSGAMRGNWAESVRMLVECGAVREVRG